MVKTQMGFSNFTPMNNHKIPRTFSTNVSPRTALNTSIEATMKLLQSQKLKMKAK
jgi:hypothetical protein